MINSEVINPFFFPLKTPNSFRRMGYRETAIMIAQAINKIKGFIIKKPQTKRADNTAILIKLSTVRFCFNDFMIKI
jgi:hypothetical protein